MHGTAVALVFQGAPFADVLLVLPSVLVLPLARFIFAMATTSRVSSMLTALALSRRRMATSFRWASRTVSAHARSSALESKSRCSWRSKTPRAPSAMLWGRLFDGFEADRWDLLGAPICLVVAAAVFFGPRGR